MKILVAVDDSAYSQAAMDWVKRIDWPAGTEVVVLSVARGVMVAYASPEVPVAAYSAELFEEEVKQHEEIAARYERQVREMGYKTKALVLEGDPREMIVSAAKEQKADMVVMGSHGRTGLGKLLMGSVASHVVTHAPCNVLVVKLPKTM